MRMRPRASFGCIAAGILICVGASGVARAQDESSPPGRVAQLSYAEGSVSLEPAGTSSWTSAALNRPLTIGDRLWTDESSRAELDIGDAVIRLGSTTGFSFLNLDDRTAQMQVTAGTVIVHVRTLADGEQDEIDTPNLALTLEQPGTYRVEVSDTGDTTVVDVDEGAALATGGGESYPVAAQQSVTFSGTSTLTADYATLGAPDALDQWSMQRDQEERQRSAVAQDYVAPGVVGATDLGSYGNWEQTPDWGYAWFPAVAVGWAPYTMGSWVWISPWGWTWVDQEPWGFAPFHYGRWGYWHRRWCWIPGPRRKRPLYAPALVGWIGDRRTGPVGGHVGWFPLGPRDVYVPGYHASPTYVQNINITNTRITETTITNVYTGRAGDVRYANSEIPGAVTAVPRNVFTSAQPVAPHRVVLTHRGGIGRPTTAAPAIMPVRESVLGGSAGRIVRPPPRAIIDRPVVARLAPPRAPVSFAREQAAIRANAGRPLSMSQLARLRPNTPVAPVRLAPAPGAARPARPGLELRTAPENRASPGRPGMSARERALQQPTLPPARTPRNDRPPWVQRQPQQYGTPAQRPEQPPVAPQQRPGPREWRVPPRQAAPQEPAPRFVPPPRQKPDERFAPPERQAPSQRSTPPERQAPPPRQAPDERFVPPERQVPEQRFTPSERPAPQPRFTPPPPSAPQQRYTPPSYHPRGEAAPPPREAPARPPQAPPPRVNGRAGWAPFAASTGDPRQWQLPPPMYRPQANTNRSGTGPRLNPTHEPYLAPSGPPPMYRPVPVGRAVPARGPSSSPRFRLLGSRGIG